MNKRVWLGVAMMLGFPVQAEILPDKGAGSMRSIVVTEPLPAAQYEGPPVAVVSPAVVGNRNGQPSYLIVNGWLMPIQGVPQASAPVNQSSFPSAAEAASRSVGRSHNFSQDLYNKDSSVNLYYGNPASTPYPPAAPPSGEVNASGRPSARDAASYSLNRAHGFSQGNYNPGSTSNYVITPWGAVSPNFLGYPPAQARSGNGVNQSRNPSARDAARYNLERAHRFSQDRYR
ncbi:MAG: hypothetical protein RIR00_239 [Pseudomonadota bacterium]|jgi:hypothetical protein